MNYQKLHDSLVAIGRQRGNKKRKGFELHHVIPTCMGGSDDESNKALLTYREHFVAHRILTKLYPNHSGLHYAVWRMTNDGKHNVSSRTYEKARQNFIDNHNSKTPEARARWAEDGNPGKTPENRKASSGRLTLQNLQSYAEGKHPSQKPENQKAASGRWLGSNNPASKPENRTASSKRAKEQVQCPCCDLIGGGINMKRYHFDNCFQHLENVGLTREQIKAKRSTL